MPCHNCSVNGLGQLDPASLFEIGQAVVHAKDTWDNLVASLGIGAGRREADAIVPLQNQLVDTVIAPVSGFLDQVNAKQIIPTCQELSTWKGQVTQAETQWLNFLHNTTWQDGRAAQQAEATLASYWDNAKRDLQKYVTQYCVSTIPGIPIGPIIGAGPIGPIFTLPSGETNWPAVAVAGGLAYMLFQRFKIKK